ncbi:MAG: ABC transporter substrate-binding protein [Candidatus Methanomethylicaceae archaeon]|nr:ABC transporter substrate-binding protein [Candidatus Verstraetearchaeota archaeon]
MKKRVIALLMLVLIILSLAFYWNLPKTMTSETAKPSRFTLEIYGNANMDEVIDEKDITFLRQIIDGKINATEFADANRDGKIDLADVEQVLAIINGNASYIWILDGNKQPVKVKLPVNRIGVEYLSNAELMRILGVEDKVVAVDFAPYQLRNFYFPDRADKIINLGNMFKPDYEFLNSLNLDILFTFSFDIAEKREKLVGVDVVFLGLYWPDVINVNESRFIQGIMKAGYILGKVEKAREYVDWLLNLIDLIKNRTSKLSDAEKPMVLMTGMVGYLTDPQQKTLRTYTLRDPLSQMCILAGGKPIAEELKDWSGPGYYTTVDLEWVLGKNPDYIFVHTVRYTYGGGTLLPAYGYDVNDISSLNEVWTKITSLPMLSNIKAVKNNNLYIIAGDFRNNAMGGVLGAVYIAKILHPNLFSDMNPRDIHQEYITKWMRIDYDLKKAGTFIYPPIKIGQEVIGIPSK